VPSGKEILLVHIRRLTGEPRPFRLPFFSPVLAALAGLSLLGAVSVFVPVILVLFLLICAGRAIRPGLCIPPAPAVPAGGYGGCGRMTVTPAVPSLGCSLHFGRTGSGGGGRGTPPRAGGNPDRKMAGPRAAEDRGSEARPPDDDRGAYGDVIRVIRAQRHRFLNHLQVISGWLQLEKPDKAVGYIERVRREMEGHSLLFKLDAPELAARLLTEAAAAEGNGCSVAFELEGEAERLSSLIRGRPWVPRATARALSILVGFARLVGGDDSDPIIIRFGVGERGLRVSMWAPWPAVEGGLQLPEMAGADHVRRLGGLRQAAAAAGGRVEFSALAGEGLRLILEVPAGGAGGDSPEVR